MIESTDEPLLWTLERPGTYLETGTSAHSSKCHFEHTEEPREGIAPIKDEVSGKGLGKLSK